MKTKRLATKEAATLVTLLRRAISNGQLNLAVAVPYEYFDLKNPGPPAGFDINDTHSGNAVNSTAILVDSANVNRKPEVTVYIPEGEDRKSVV